VVITKHATFHGVTPASRFFTRKLKYRVSETTVHSIRYGHDEMVKKRPHGDSQEGSDDEKLPLKKQGRLQQYALRVREGGSFFHTCNATKQATTKVIWGSHVI